MLGGMRTLGSPSINLMLMMEMRITQDARYPASPNQHKIEAFKAQKRARGIRLTDIVFILILNRESQEGLHAIHLHCVSAQVVASTYCCIFFLGTVSDSDADKQLRCFPMICALCFLRKDANQATLETGVLPSLLMLSFSKLSFSESCCLSRRVEMQQE
jgi:hypothetical protein